MYKVTVTQIQSGQTAAEIQVAIAPAIEVFSQTLPELNLAEFIRVLNPRTRRKRKVKDAAATAAKE